jgi:RNA-directed DNA polymerase
MLKPSYYSAMARSILEGESSVDAITKRLWRTLGRKWRWIRPLGRRYVLAFAAEATGAGVQVRPRRRDVVAFLKADQGLRDAEHRYKGEIQIAEWLTAPAGMQPADVARSWPLPKIETEEELAAWLSVSINELRWYADLKRLNARVGAGDGPVNHYHYRLLTKTSGNVRLIESPKKKLKELQRIILRELVEAVPNHSAVHGFVKGRSIKTFAAPHGGKSVVLRMDLQDFFPSIAGARVQALFRTAGYPEGVADLLGGLCTNAAPRGMWKTLAKGLDTQAMAEARERYAWRHLPQGAPTSPALANLCAYRVDCRLSGLSKASGAVYTRYADDLAFSGDEKFGRCVERFAVQVAAILREEGFHVHHRKTRVMRQGVRQHLAGLVINEHVNVVREDFDRLKAILTNSVRHGAESQNREGHPAFRMHLDGRVGFVEMVNPVKGVRLRRIFERIKWG